MYVHSFEITWIAAGALLLGAAMSAFVLAAEAPHGQTSGYEQAYRAGMEKYRGAGMTFGDALDYAGARNEFRRASELAATDNEKAEALLSLGRASLIDVNDTDMAAMRAGYARVLALKTLTPRQRAEALLGTAQTHLGEKDYHSAREACAQARAATDDPVWAGRAQMLLARSCVQERNYGAAHKELRKVLAVEGAEELTKWEAEALIGALDLAPRIRAGHPRLFITEETWPAVKRRALTAERERFDQMKARVEALLLDGIGPDRNWAKEAMDAAFVYRVTRDPAVLEKVRRMLRVTMDVLPERREHGSYRVYEPLAWLAALDWVWNDLPAAERQALADAMLGHAWTLVAEDRTYETGRMVPTLMMWPSYYWHCTYGYAGLALLDPAGDEVAQARVVSLLGIGLKHHQERFAWLVRRAGDDGAWQRNLDYDFGEKPTQKFAFLHAWKGATGEELPDEWADVGISPGFALRAAVDFAPGSFKYFNFAGQNNGCWGRGEWQSDLLYDYLGQYIHFFGKSHPKEAAIAGYLRQRMVAAGAGPADGQYPIFQFFLTGLESAPEPVLPAGLPIARHFENAGLVLMSSGFGPEDTYALFCAGGGLDLTSSDWDATHFSIYKKGHLALDTGTRFAIDHSPNYRHMTVAHNAVLIHMPGERFPTSSLGPVTSNAGGQNRYPVDARTLAFETHPAFAYVVTDATPVYNEAKCAQMVRQLLFLPPDHFVVFDRVTAKKAEYPKTWLLHTSNEPMIAGKEFRADQDRGRIFCRTLYPLDAVLEKIGGPGKEFWADGRNWAILHPLHEPGAGNWWKRHGRGHTEPPEAMGRWRVEVKPGAPRTEDCFLHLLQASDQTVAKMIESRVQDKGDHIELTFVANARAYTIALNKTGEVGGHIRIAEGERVRVDRPLTREVMPQSGLALAR
ncbi:MAG: hypothetical protein HY321_01255 [Armatimonadetes bacterium]|nr:hypothetical protein [Armatimonadota bacterium]